MNSRNSQIDIMRAVGIILVVYGHTGAFGTSSIYLFHMPLFIMLSGYCMRNECYKLEDLFKTVRKKLRTLYLPYIKYMLIFLFLHNFLILIGILPNSMGQIGSFKSGYYNLHDFIVGSIKILLFSGGEQLGSALWFLRALFIVILVYSVIELIANSFLKNSAFQLISICSFIVGLVGWMMSIYQVEVPLNLSSACSCLPIFHLGRCIRLYSIKPTNSSAMVGAVILMLLGFVYKVDLSQNIYPSLPLLILFSISGWCSVWRLASAIASSELHNTFCWIGRNTLSIMALHLLCFKLVSLLGILQGSSLPSVLSAFPIYQGTKWLWLLYLIVGVFAPILIQRSFDSITRKLFKFGKEMGLMI